MSLALTGHSVYNLTSNRRFLMQDLIHELQLPRQISPSASAIRAAKALQELSARAQNDTQARLVAEAKLVEAFGDIQRLTKELQDAKTTIDTYTASASANKSSEPT